MNSKQKKDTEFSMGTHIILDCYDVPRDVCMDDKLLLEAAVQSAASAKATIINTMRYQFGHDSPPGCSVIIMLDESHISIHTYADQRMMAIDVFTCGKIISDQAILSLKESLSLNNCIEHRLNRFVTETSEHRSH